MTDILFEDSKLRHLLHQVTNCHQALYGYCELGETIRALAIVAECIADLKLIEAELHLRKSAAEKQMDDEHES